jgi:dGTPase
MLGRLRLPSAPGLGRRFPEPPHPYRNDFQRDRDRIIHSRAFRRLEGKTQVFAIGLGDHFRNRLTHTIEVAQVARTVAVALHLNEEYTETLALAHDLGHPPFGHSGERELDRKMAQYGSGFEHNRHALRIVDTLEERYARFDGLNLTFEVREGIAKHSRELVRGVDPEWDELMPELRPPLEAQLLDAADEIAYNTADLDDAFSAGLLSVDEIAEVIPVFAELTESVDMQFPGASPRVRFWEVQRNLMNFLIGGLVEGTTRAADAAGVQTVDDVRNLTHRVATMLPEAAAVSSQVKALLVRKVYSYPDVADIRSQAVVKIGELFDYLMEHPQQVSPGYRECLAFSPAHRVVCDYLAGMTDGFFLRTYNALISGANR